MWKKDQDLRKRVERSRCRDEELNKQRLSSIRCRYACWSSLDGLSRASQLVSNG